jgi:hypothetical protein
MQMSGEWQTGNKAAMPSEVVNIKTVIRPMRGGSQAHLIEGDDGSYYVAKFAGNPQGNRTLVNECIATRLFQQFGISTPPIRLLHLSRTVQEAASLNFSIRNKKVPVSPGIHFGSQCPVHSHRTAIYDFLPRKLLANVENLEDFLKAFVLDKLLGNADRRQAVFVRTTSRTGKARFRAWLIDHGLMFAGQRWQLEDVPGYGLYTDRGVYGFPDTQIICDKAIEMIRTLTADQLHAATEGIPSDWFSSGDGDALIRLLHDVQARAARLPFFVRHHLEVLRETPEFTACL